MRYCTLSIQCCAARDAIVIMAGNGKKVALSWLKNAPVEYFWMQVVIKLLSVGRVLAT